MDRVWRHPFIIENAARVFVERLANERTVLVDVVSVGAYLAKIESSWKLHQYSPTSAGISTMSATEADAATERRKKFIDHASACSAVRFSNFFVALDAAIAVIDHVALIDARALASRLRAPFVITMPASATALTRN